LPPKRSKYQTCFTNKQSQITCKTINNDKIDLINIIAFMPLLYDFPCPCSLQS